VLEKLIFPYANEALDVPKERRKGERGDTKMSHRETIGFFSLKYFFPPSTLTSQPNPKGFFRFLIAKINKILSTQRALMGLSSGSFNSQLWLAEK
jgi:hypothetical protein